MQPENTQIVVSLPVNQPQPRRPYRGSWLGRPIALLLLLLCSPLLISNSLMALCLGRRVLLRPESHNDCQLQGARFSTGLFRNSACLFSLLAGRIALCGISPGSQLTNRQRQQLMQRYAVKPALLDAAWLHSKTGLAVTNPYQLIEQQLNGSALDYLKLCLKGLFCQLMFRQRKALTSPRSFSVFGVWLDNHSMAQAVDWVTSGQPEQPCATAVFVNANSINQAAANRQLRRSIALADRVFADGSGIRLAAQTAGFHLASNINGTDMLPLLCQAAVQRNQSLFLLGARPGVAEKMAANLQSSYPGLTIRGCADGYFRDGGSAALIQQINASRCDILLLALGSPRQERWLAKHARSLTCRRALAVGGLFDYYSGNIARAPLWMRELGLEWIWRLIQEPRAKFYRYVIGNPLFLFRIFVLRQHIRGFES